MRWRPRTKGRTERGAAAVEFAFIMIPLLLVICGIINFGVIFAQQLSLDNATRAAARAAVVDSGAVVGDRVTEEFAGALARSSAGVVAVDLTDGVGATCDDSNLGDMMVVEATVTTNVLIPWLFPDTLLPSSIELDSKAAFQCEYS